MGAYLAGSLAADQAHDVMRTRHLPDVAISGAITTASSSPTTIFNSLCTSAFLLLLAEMSEYRRIPSLDPRTCETGAESVELEPLGTASKPYPDPQRSSLSDRTAWWITVVLAVNVVIMLVNLYLTSSFGSTIASLRERPLSELPRPDPLYGVRRPG